MFARVRLVDTPDHPPQVHAHKTELHAGLPSLKFSPLNLSGFITSLGLAIAQ
jgi:hypothetical protein